MRVKGRERFSQAILRAILAAGLVPALAYAEPSVSGAHLPILWIMVLVGAGMAAAIPMLVKKYMKPKLPGWVFWVASIALALIVLVFVGPIVIVVGSILITGRTM